MNFLDILYYTKIKLKVIHLYNIIIFVYKISVIILLNCFAMDIIFQR